MARRTPGTIFFWSWTSFGGERDLAASCTALEPGGSRRGGRWTWESLPGGPGTPGTIFFWSWTSFGGERDLAASCTALEPGGSRRGGRWTWDFWSRLPET